MPFSRLLLSVTCCLLTVASWAQSHTIYLIGDAGEPFDDGNPVIKQVKSHLDQDQNPNSVIYLGDNIYPNGLPELDDSDRDRAEQIMVGQLEILKGYSGNVYVIPGNHDWDKSRKDGYQQIRRQEKFVQSYLATILKDSINAFLPDNGCPGPLEIPISEDITLIILDTQWVLHPWDKPRTDDGCEAGTYQDVFDQLEEMVKRNDHKKVVVAGHHPIYSYGMHGGTSNTKQHLFPLTDINESLYIPLPIIGSVYPLFRKYLGNIQDIAHPKYKALRHAMEEIFQQHPNLVYVAGHEHSLQYIAKDSTHYVVSGAGSKSTFVKKKQYSQFAYEQLGFGKLIFHADGKSVLEFWSPEVRDKPVYQQLLYEMPYEPLPSADEFNVDFSDSTVFVNASDQYETENPGLLGENYRKAWKTKVEVPVFDIAREKGGLEIVKRGGGQQTRSLRLEAKNEKQYVLRSVEKYAEKAIPEELLSTVGEDLVQDQISASHPYAAYVIPPLAEAAEIYHTNPKLVYIPDDPRFGKYRVDFANSMALFEERPDDDWEDADYFGNSKKIMGTPDVLEELYDDNDNRIDQQWVLKSRLFDMFIGDWDRHDDQWRWASFKESGGRIFRPIPRDRDQAFFVNQGFIMNKVKRKWAMPKFQGFDYKFSYVPGFNFNARYFDRDFLNEPSLQDWINTADSLQQRLTDEVIENAIRQWPKPIYEIDGEEVIAKLKSQRSHLKDYAMEQYLFLSKAVNVRGSDKKEFFLVERLDDERTRVRMYKRTNEDNTDEVMYDRTFLKNETKEIRLYGLGHDDFFEIKGESGKGILVRIIGGPGEDTIRDQSKVSGLRKHTKVYDTKKGNLLELGSEAKDLTSNRANVNNYNRKEFNYDRLIPLIIASINRDDGLFLGGGVIYENHGFRKSPVKSRHMVTAQGAFATGAFHVKYDGRFTDALGLWDLKLGIDVSAPNSVTNFFGFGNETIFNQSADEDFQVDRPIDYYRLRFKYFNQSGMLVKKFGASTSFGIGHHFQTAKVEDHYDGDDRFILDPENIDDPDFFSWKAFEGAVFQFHYDSRDNPRLTTRGINWLTEFRAYAGLNDRSKDVAMINSEISFFFSLRLPSKLTVATRFGGGHNFGSSEFYQAQVLGGLSNLRGYRKTRFAGDSKFYNNTELRLKLGTFRNRIIPISMGIYGFNDVGRVWYSGEESNKWHHGIGGGIWLAPLNISVISLDLARSQEEVLFNFRLGFLL